MTGDRTPWVRPHGEPAVEEWAGEEMASTVETSQRQERRARKAAEIEELLDRQEVKPFTSMEELAAWEDPFESDEEHAAFLRDLYESRRDGRRSTSFRTPT